MSRVQFDATTEQLNHMMQELVAKMSGQEQDWQKMLDKLLVQMDNKVRGRRRLQRPRGGDSTPLSGRRSPHLLPGCSPGPPAPPTAGPPGAGPREAVPGGSVEILATAAQRALPPLPGGRGRRHAEVRAAGLWLEGSQRSSALLAETIAE